MNVEGQLLGTRGEYGYLITDIGVDYPDEVLAKLRAMPQTVRLRVLSVSAPVTTLEAELVAVVGAGHVLTDGRPAGAVRDRLDPPLHRAAALRGAPGRHRRGGRRGAGLRGGRRADHRRRAATPAWSAAACHR